MSSQLIRGNTFAGTAFSSYGCFWMGWSLWHYWEITNTMDSVIATARTGESLWCGLWGFLTLFFFVATLRKNGCLQTIFGSLFITFFLLIGANYSAECKKAAGYVGFFCGASAIYTAIAELYQVCAIASQHATNHKYACSPHVHAVMVVCGVHAACTAPRS